MSAAPSLDPSGQASPAPPALGADQAQTLFERHSAAIYGYCFNRLGGREEAEDAVQTTFLNAFRALRRGVVPEYESAWLHKIAENVCRGRHRSAGRRREVVQDPMALAEVAPAAQRERDELFGLDEALERMAPRQRRALLLREWKGLSYREIGQELRLSPAAVETLLFRARRSLARNLQFGSFIGWLKTVLSGSAAVKAAAAASVVVASAGLSGDSPVDRAAGTGSQAPATAVSRASADRGAPSDQAATSPGAVAQVREREATKAARVGRRQSSGRRGSQPARSSPRATEPTGSTPAGDESGAGTPATQAPVDPTPPPAPRTTSPPPPPPAPLPIQIPPAPPPVTLLPELLPLPSLPSLPPPPALPPAPELPPLPQLPPVPEVPKLSQLPKLP